MKFSERLNELITEFNLTPNDLVEKLNLENLSTIYVWKSGKSLPRIESLISMANYFNCSIDYLLGRTDNFEKFVCENIIPFDIQLNKILKEKNITKYKLMKNCNFTKGHLNSWFNLKSYPSPSNAIKLADYLGVSVDYLLGRI